MTVMMPLALWQVRYLIEGPNEGKTSYKTACPECLGSAEVLFTVGQKLVVYSCGGCGRFWDVSVGTGAECPACGDMAESGTVLTWVLSKQVLREELWR